MRPTIILSLAAVTAMLALSGPPHELPAAPTNLTPPNPAGNAAALADKEAELEAVKAELAALKQSMKVAPVVSPVSDPVPVGEPIGGQSSDALTVRFRAPAGTGPGCAGGNCAVPRARVQAATEGRRWQRQSRRLLPWRR